MPWTQVAQTTSSTNNSHAFEGAIVAHGLCDGLLDGQQDDSIPGWSLVWKT